MSVGDAVLSPGVACVSVGDAVLSPVMAVLCPLVTLVLRPGVAGVSSLKTPC